MARQILTTLEAAAAVGITRATLQEWIGSGKVGAPEPVIVEGRATRLWTPAHLAELKAVKKKIYWKGRGRKKRSK